LRQYVDIIVDTDILEKDETYKIFFFLIRITIST